VTGFRPTPLGDLVEGRDLAANDRYFEAHVQLQDLAQVCATGGLSQRTAMRALQARNHDFDEPLTKHELSNLVKNAVPRGARVPGAKTGGMANGTHGKLRRLDVAHMARTVPEPPDFLVESVVARGEVTVLWGAPGKGKSLFSEACTRGVALGEPVAGLDCKQGRVAYFDAENGEYEIHRRVRGLGFPAKDVAIFDAGSGVHLVHDLDEFRAALAEIRPAMVVLDSLRRLTPGSEENDSGAMAEAIGATKALAQEFDCGVLVIHHARKDGGEYRGSSAIRDQVSISWRLSQSETDKDRSRRVLSNDKMRIGPEPEDLALRIEYDDDSIGIVAADLPAGGQRLATGRQRSSLAEQILSLLDDRPAKRPALAGQLGRTAKDGTVRRALEELEEGGYVRRLKDGNWERVPVASTPDLANGELAPSGQGASPGASGEQLAPRTKKRRRA
jgi:DNA-binding transcriptional ArsR family regulator